jgi:hypothetical protein
VASLARQGLRRKKMTMTLLRRRLRELPKRQEERLPCSDGTRRSGKAGLRK